MATTRALDGTLQGDLVGVRWLALWKAKGYDASWRCQATQGTFFGNVVLHMAFFLQARRKLRSLLALSGDGTLALGGVSTRYALHTLGSTSYILAGMQRRCQAGYDAVG